MEDFSRSGIFPYSVVTLSTTVLLSHLLQGAILFTGYGVFVLQFITARGISTSNQYKVSSAWSLSSYQGFGQDVPERIEVITG